MLLKLTKLTFYENSEAILLHTVLNHDNNNSSTAPFKLL